MLKSLPMYYVTFCSLKVQKLFQRTNETCSGFAWDDDKLRKLHTFFHAPVLFAPIYPHSQEYLNQIRGTP